MKISEVEKLTSKYSSEEIILYIDNDHLVYKSIIEETTEYFKDKNVMLVVGILNSGKKPAVDIALNLNVPASFVEYHKTIDNTGDIPYPKIKTSVVDYPVSTFKMVNTDKAIKYTIPFKIDEELEAEIIKNNGIVLVVDDSTSSGHNCVLAAWDILNNSKLKAENLAYMSLYKSIHNALNAPLGHSSKEVGYSDTYFPIVANIYRLKPQSSNILEGSIYFPNISGSNLNIEEYLKKLKRGREFYKEVPYYY